MVGGKMIIVNEKGNCTGCHACANACPKNCIQMKEDIEGFLYPLVNSKLCIDCGLCEKVCPMQNEKSMTPDKIDAYGMVNLDNDTRQESSSGGIFSLLVEKILQDEGIVYGACFNENFEVYHKRITKLSELETLRGSKYVQSKIGDCFQQVKKDLIEDRIVLFTGTSCQVDGLRNYLGKEYNNLYCQDILCHGVPSPKLWRKYLTEHESYDIQSISFRDKSINWSQFSLSIQGKSQSKKEVFYKNDFMRCFLSDMALRPSCYQCKYKNLKLPGDLTLADFWGVDYACPEVFDPMGVSLVLVNTEKGQQLVDLIRDRTICVAVTLDKAIEGNQPAVIGAKTPKNRSDFFEHIDDYNVKKLVNTYIRGGFISRVVKKVKKILHR